jgi:hypothetical protein
MNLEARAARTVSQSKPALADMEVMTIADWGALKFDLHQKLQELKQSGDGYWQGIESDLEAKIIALEKSIRSSNSCSGNILRGGVRQPNKAVRSSEQTELGREHSGLKEAQANPLPNLAPGRTSRHGGFSFTLARTHQKEKTS